MANLHSFILLSISALFVLQSGKCQRVEPIVIRQMIGQYKSDPRGPYKDIRWFCNDGTFKAPGESCGEAGGVQRARYKDEVLKLAKSNHIFIGQILSTTNFKEFWDEESYHSRLKQYQLEKYLRAADDGWILRRARYYRGAYQVEDEESWGIEFLKMMCAEDSALRNHFYLIRQAAKDVPHKGDDNKTQNIRAVSKYISDKYAAFMDLRVKIHGQPERSDVQRVVTFRNQHQSKLSPELLQKFDELISDMQAVYSATNLKNLQKYIRQLPNHSDIRNSLSSFVVDFSGSEMTTGQTMVTAEKLWEIRLNILSVSDPKVRLALLDISNELEEICLLGLSAWKAFDLKDLLDKICFSGMASVGTGHLEEWEYENIRNTLAVPDVSSLSLEELTRIFETSRKILEWGSGTVRARYDQVVRTFGEFEPMAFDFFDDRIRSSVLLPLGHDVGILGEFIAEQAHYSNHVLDIPNQSHIHGLNPGFAKGRLTVVKESPEDLEVVSDRIYIFSHPPSDLKPVAGIATVTEGNMVSHVQLLARNLGIPNAVISSANLNDLLRYNNMEVFYAVSPKGTVIMKSVDNMSNEEAKLFENSQRKDNRIRVPTDKIDLPVNEILDLRQVQAEASGKICGPKAANLGQLKYLFPENVVEGLVIPFGIFRLHMDQEMPGKDISYWEYLNSIFEKAESRKAQQASTLEVEKYLLAELDLLRAAIKEIKFYPSFISDLENKFSKVLGRALGDIGVFLRSDTNMEDLKEFTGAGLNLTLFNVLDREKILQGIKDVWASPYTERSYRWRQHYLLNPENVYPSILIIPSVNVDYSGVLITKGVTSGHTNDITIAFNRGAGGAVDGQASESYLLAADGQNILLSPAREPSSNFLPLTGGTKKAWHHFNDPVLSSRNLMDLRRITQKILTRLNDSPEFESGGPYDIELGFLDDHIWLFQIRPFVENKNASASLYLESITPRVNLRKRIGLDSKI